MDRGYSWYAYGGDWTYQLEGFIPRHSVDYEDYWNNDGCYGYGHDHSKHNPYNTRAESVR